MKDKEFRRFEGLQVAEDGEVIWTTTYKTGHQHTFRTYGYKKPCGHRVVSYKGKNYFVHRLVAECFLNGGEPIDTKTYAVHHINGNPEDNKVSNLLILTHDEHTALHHKGKVLSDETKRKISDAVKKAIIGVHKVTGEVREFDSATDAERVLGINQSNITKCCRGKKQSAGGWRFMYKPQNWLDQKIREI